MHIDLPASDPVGNDEGKRAGRVTAVRSMHEGRWRRPACFRAPDLTYIGEDNPGDGRWIRQYGITEHARRRLLRNAGDRLPRRLDRRAHHEPRHGLFTNILVGIAGSFVGGTLAGLLGIALSTASSAIWSSPSPARSSSCGSSAAPAPAPEPQVQSQMVTLLDTALKPRARHPEKAHRPDQEVLRKPDWIRVKAPVSRGYAETRDIVKSHELVTVCEEAGCPNIGECWDKKHATFMIMGEICTRACAFCNVATGMPGPLDPRRAGERRQGGRQDGALPRRHHLGRPRRSRRRRRAAFRRRHPRDPRGDAGDHDRDPDAGLPAQGRRAGDRGRGQARRLQPQSRDGAVELPDRAARRPLLPFDPAVAAGEGTRSRRCSPSRASWSASARSGTRCCS